MTERVFFPSVLLILAACGGGPEAEFRTVVQDSAGVRVVENRGLSALGALGWSVEEQPVLDLGGAASAPELYQVMDAVRLQDGRIVVASNGSKALQVYSPDGQHLQTIGREGEGPGEFQSVLWVGRLPGDTIAAWDPSLGRLSVFGPDASLVRVVTPRGSLGLLPRAQGVLADGRLVLATGAGAGVGASPQSRAYRDTLTYVVLGNDGALADTLGRFPGTEMIGIGGPGAGLLLRPLPFGRTTSAAVHEGRVYISTGDRYEIGAYSPGTGLQAVIRADRDPVPVTQQDIRDYREALVTLGGDGGARQDRQRDQLLDEAPYPETMPPLTALEVDAEGNLWAEEPRKPGSEQGSLWTVLSPQGVARGTVRLPRGLRVKQIGVDWILGVALDENDVEHVRLHRLTKPAGGRATNRS
ncbi:MAG: hypothetical protein AB1941_01650 [Gemmatimonadota bacterium]